MKTQTAFYVGTHPDSFRSGEPARIDGVEMVSTEHGKRACFKLTYADGRTDFSVISDTKNYVIVVQENVELVVSNTGRWIFKMKGETK